MRSRGNRWESPSHALVASNHQGGPEVVVRLAGGFEGGMGLPILGEGEGLEAAGQSVAKPVFRRRGRRSAPRFRGGGIGARRRRSGG